jgi:multidrug resistance efflux pump
MNAVQPAVNIDHHESPPVPTRGSWHPPPRKPLGTAAIVIAALVALIVVLRAWNLAPFSGAIEKTDNAYVRGRTTVIAPQVSGYVVEVAIRDYEDVKQGQVLVTIDDRTYRARVEQARANLSAQKAALANNKQAHASRTAVLRSQIANLGSANAQLQRAKADISRVENLVKDGSVSVRERDQTLAALRQAEAQVQQGEAAIEVARQDIRTVEVGQDGLQSQVEAAQAQLHLAEIDLDHTIIRAPEAGQLGEVGVRLGQYVTNGTQLVSLVPMERWIIANYKEAQTAHMTVGQKAAFTVDALDGARFNGRIERLSPAAGSEFSVLKPDNATGNFVKVPQRIGVRIVVDTGQKGTERLQPGMSVETMIDTSRAQ